ncbi:hypothetical protein D3C71_1591400 [compost metagenome]
MLHQVLRVLVLPALDQRREQRFAVFEVPVETGAGKVEFLRQRQHAHGVYPRFLEGLEGRIEPALEGATGGVFRVARCHVHGRIVPYPQGADKLNVHLCLIY